MMDDWTPPSEEEALRLKKQRERNNQISKLMGNYLLKGYKMLGSTCNKCQAILLRDRQGEDFCVGCVEVDGSSSSFPPDVAQVHGSKPPEISDVTNKANRSTQIVQPNIINGNVSSDASLRINTEKAVDDQTLNCIYQQISWANNCLSLRDINLEQRSQLIDFIKNCYETINTIVKKS